MDTLNTKESTENMTAGKNTGTDRRPTDAAPLRRPVPVLSIVVPCYNEEETLEWSVGKLTALLGRMVAEGLIAEGSYLELVNDGSRDRTEEIMRRLCAADPGRCRAILLAANAGHQNALLAGIETTVEDADVIVTIDADLQDDIEAIPRMVRDYMEGADVVYGVRLNRDSDSAFKRYSATRFYKMMHSLGVRTVYNHADFRLLSRRAALDLLDYTERNIYLRGLVPMLGYKQTSVGYTRVARHAGETKYPLRKMVDFAVEGITSFSVRPVRLVFGIGILFMLIAMVIFVYAIVRYCMGATIEGWTSLIISIWFCSGILLAALGVIGEYIGKIYLEVKHRPRYHVQEKLRN